MTSKKSMRARWKRCEGRFATLIGGTRIPITGREELDIDHRILAVEIKQRESLPQWCFGKAVKQALTGAEKCGKIPVVAVNEVGSQDFWIVMHHEWLVQLLDLIGEENE